ncbi:calmodulin-binding protein 60 B-like isoform X2 [Rutidosis leptorrhynchoides]|uniref:calmodulin-binding protein 60 B-like isoform X2 n=1 Tax=Rutidosis leptorrhynchoides TaxID=125765 RepID=UPI003A9A61E9
MVLKRLLGEGEGDGNEFRNRGTKQRTVTSSFARDVMYGHSTQELASTLEPLIRRWVREEVQLACQRFCCSSPSKTSLQLRFATRFSQKLFTGSRVESENNGVVQIVLFDTETNQVVTSGPLSSLKIQIVPLDGEFSVDDDEDWSKKDFEAKIIYARDGKRPLVTGDLVVVLKDGVGDLGEVYFTDNSSWIRSRTFRLGAQAVVSDVRIKEARSEPFVVKDHRGESYKKHHPPSLDDDIWRLEKISKDGAFRKRLAEKGIRTVKHFLQMYVTNESSLRKILGESCIKIWDAIIKHAKDCIIDDNLFMYNCGTEGATLLFNCIFKIVGVIFDGQDYLSLDNIPKFQMPRVESLKQQFYKNLNGMLPMDDFSVFGGSMLTASFPLRNVVNLGLQDVNMPAINPDQVQLASEPYLYGIGNNSQYIAEGSSMQMYSPDLRNNYMLRDFGNGPYGEGSTSGPSMLSGQVAADFDFQHRPSIWEGNEVCSGRCNQLVNMVSSDFNIRYSRNGSPRGRWCKIRAAVKWVLVMRDVAERRMANLYPYLNI